jgi:hypothetical protein
MYTYESLSVECTVQNKGNTLLEDISICIKTDCYEIDLGIARSEETGFGLSFDSAGKKDISVTVKNEEVFKIYSMSVEVFDVPEITISNLYYDDPLNYDSESQIGFTLLRESYSIPKDIAITLHQDSRTRYWNIPELKEDKEFIIDITGKEFTKEIMDAKIVVEYKDVRGKAYSTEEEFSIRLEEPTFWQKIKMSVNRVGNWFASLF